ncbi:MAG: hypothetical protein FD177_1030 [Desulfovibrionaceae bacterium]|nr:MAG: hypothetical protein FD177_1030 [Desulfovibrionaceae bacterium]
MRKFMNAFHWENVLTIFYVLCTVALLILLACDKYMMGPFR